MTVLETDIVQFFAATGISDASVATNYLEMAGYNVNQAVSLYFDLGPASTSSANLQSGPNDAMPSSPKRPAADPNSPLPEVSDARPQGAARSLHSPKRTRHEQAADPQGGTVGEPTSRDSDEHVPAPLPVFTERLFVDSWDSRTKRASKDAPSVTNTMVDYADDSSSGTQAFSSLFQPPDDIICSLELEDAMAMAKGTEKWVLVNIQKTEEFLSHALNRDVWNDKTIREVLTKNFVFWQRNADTGEGLAFTILHKIESFPFVGLICHRTGRLLCSWNPQRLVQNVPDTIAQLIDFLETSTHATGQICQGETPAASLPKSSANRDDATDVPSNNSSATNPGLFQGKGYSLATSDVVEVPAEMSSMNATLAEMHREREKRRLEQQGSGVPHKD